MTRKENTRHVLTACEGAMPTKKSANEKYIITDETTRHAGRTLHRIEALVPVGGIRSVMPGDKGGWIEEEMNLDIAGDSWIFDDAMVYGGGRVQDSAVVSGNARVYNGAVVKDKASVWDSAIIKEGATMRGQSYAGDRAIIANNSTVSGAVQGDAYVKNTDVPGRCLLNSGTYIDMIIPYIHIGYYTIIPEPSDRISILSRCTKDMVFTIDWKEPTFNPDLSYIEEDIRPLIAKACEIIRDWMYLSNDKRIGVLIDKREETRNNRKER